MGTPSFTLLEKKIERNRRRDLQNFRKLRRAGWTVLRLWEHEVVDDVEACVDRISNALKQQVAKALGRRVVPLTKGRLLRVGKYKRHS